MSEQDSILDQPPLGLTPRQLEIWNGTSNLSPEREAAYRALWAKRLGIKDFKTTKQQDKIDKQQDKILSNVTSKIRGLHNCIYMGKDTGDRVQCPSCSGKVELKLFSCAIHGVCTRGKSVSGIACCTKCENYEPSKE